VPHTEYGLFITFSGQVRVYLLSSSGTQDIAKQLAKPERLRALASSELMDSAPEPEFDRVTRLICQLLKVEVSLVSLVDTSRQFFKSSCGLPADVAEIRGTPLSHSFCQHVVATENALVVPNAPNHPLVASNLAIRDLNVKAYLGVPIRSVDGQVLGSLCALETKPRNWTEADKAALEDFALIVQDAIRLRDTAISAMNLATRSDTLAKEYSHRAKNSLAVASALVHLSAKESGTATELSANLQRRLRALSSAHDALKDADDAIELSILLSRLLQPFVSEQQLMMGGPNITIARLQVTPLSLIIHELATNSTKYGALKLGGAIKLSWNIEEKNVKLIWVEDAGESPSEEGRLGFGQTLFNLAARQLHGEIHSAWSSTILTVTLLFKMQPDNG
jgi:two-component sensor histidine kinase